jgi:hypothetical protein
MFRRGKDNKKPVANKLGRQSEPNKLSWSGSDAASADEQFDEQELAEDESDELDDEDLEDDEAGDEEDAETAERQAELQAELARQAEEFGLTGSNPTAAYGANGQAVAALLDRLERIRPTMMERVADAWDSVDPAERDIVNRELDHRHRDGRHRDELAAAEQMVTDWLNARVHADEDEATLARIVADAAKDAVDALILDRDLDDADYETLYGPWAEAMGTGEEDGDTDAQSDEETEGDAGEFGPNTELVGQFLTRLAALDPVELAELATSWGELSKSDLRRAHRTVKGLVDEDEGWRAQVKGAQERISAWADGPHPPRIGKKGSLTPPDPEAVQAAIPAAVDAITALVLADLLEPEDAETLYLAWADTIGEPAFPEFEEDDDEDDEDDEDD